MNKLIEVQNSKKLEKREMFMERNKDHSCYVINFRIIRKHEKIEWIDLNFELSNLIELTTNRTQ